MAMHVRDGSSWKTVLAIKAYDGSSWINGANATIWDGTSWVGFLDKVRLVGGSYTINAGFGQATLTWGLSASTGGFTGSGSGNGYWCQNTNNTDLYEVQVTVENGPVSGPTGLGNWSNLGTTREWSLTNATGVDADAQLSVTVRNIVTEQVLASAQVNLTIIGIV